VPDLGPLMLSIGRTVLAAAVAGPMLLLTRQPWPQRADWLYLLAVIAGVIFGFPVLSSIAMKSAPASHGAVVLGALPLATALMSTVFAGERPSLAFWFWSLAGSASVVTFALLDGGASLQGADILLVLAVLAASMCYAAGAQLAKRLGGWQVISWALMLALPVTLPVTAWLVIHMHGDVTPLDWGCFAYVSLMSQLAGFYFWNRGLALGGIAKVGQVQLLQTFMTLAASALIVGETITLRAIFFAVVVGLCVFMGRKAAIRR